MKTKYGKDVIQGLAILINGITNDFLPDEFVTTLYPQVVKMVGEAGLASLTLLAPDDQSAELRAQAGRVREILRETGLSD